jgi:hypothetical protein
MVEGGSTRQPLGQLSVLAHFTSEPLALANLTNTAWRNQAMLVKVMGPRKTCCLTKCLDASYDYLLNNKYGEDGPTKTDSQRTLQLFHRLAPYTR